VKTALVVFALAAMSITAPVGAASGAEMTPLPPAMREVDIEERLGSKLDLDLTFTDTTGKEVRLTDSFRDGKPVVLTLAYFRCPMLCGLVLRGLVSSLSELKFDLGQEYRALTVSFDPRDRPEEAARKQATTLTSLHRQAKGEDWPFLVGKPNVVRALAASLGFRFAWDERSGQYAHPAVVFVLTPDGRISRYLYGTEFPTRDVKLALVEAGSGRIGTIVDRILLTCYRFDPAARRYGPFLRGFMRIGAFLILLTVATLLFVLFRAERRRRAAAMGRP